MNGFFTLLLIAIGLSMDAFAVSICDGLCYKKLNKLKGILIAFTFGLFQGLMPTVGYFLGRLFTSRLEAFTHYIAFALLFLIGVNMIYEAIKKMKQKENIQGKIFSYKDLFFQGIATSIDALAVGVSFTIMSISIWVCSLVICITTFVISLIGIIIGKKMGDIFKGKAEIAGGLILIAISIKILIESFL